MNRVPFTKIEGSERFHFYIDNNEKSFPNRRGSRVAGFKSRVAGFEKVAGFQKSRVFKDCIIGI